MPRPSRARCGHSRRIPGFRLRRRRVRAARPGAGSGRRPGLRAAAPECRLLPHATRRAGRRAVGSACRRTARARAGRRRPDRLLPRTPAADHPRPGDGRAQLPGRHGRLQGRADRRPAGTAFLPDAYDRRRHDPAVARAHRRRRRRWLAGHRHGAPAWRPGGRVRRAPRDPRADRVAGRQVPRPRRIGQGRGRLRAGTDRRGARRTAASPCRAPAQRRRGGDHGSRARAAGAEDPHRGDGGRDARRQRHRRPGRRNRWQLRVDPPGRNRRLRRRHRGWPVEPGQHGRLARQRDVRAQRLQFPVTDDPGGGRGRHRLGRRAAVENLPRARRAGAFATGAGAGKVPGRRARASAVAARG